MVSFLPDLEVFEEGQFDYDTLAHRIREMAFLTAGLAITLVDDRGEPTHRDLEVRRRHRRVRAPHQLRQGAGAREGDPVRGRHRRGRRRGRDAVERQLHVVGLLVRQQHQHARGRLAPDRLQGRAHVDAEPVRPRPGRAEGEGREPLRRRRARGARGDRLGEAARAAVRGPDEDEARQPVHGRLRPAHHEREAGGVPRGEPQRGPRDRAEGRAGGAGAARGPQGA